MQNSRNSRGRNWCFTLHIADGDSYVDQGLFVDQPQLRFAIWQREACPETGRMHYQGYCEFSVSIRFNAVKSIIGPTAHIEQRSGSRKACIEYCSKEASRVAGPWTYGDADSVQQGRRTDLHDSAEAVRDGATMSTLVESRPDLYVKYRRGFEALRGLHLQKQAMQWRTINCMVYYGDAGTGKTRRAISNSVSDGSDYYILDQGERVWFDGYDGQKVLIIDDFYGWIKYGQLLRILDGHPYRCEIKGSFTYALWTTIIITSNKKPSEWYSQGLTPALQRRISEVAVFTASEDGLGELNKLDDPLSW